MRRSGKRLRQTVEPQAEGMELGRYLRQRLGFTRAQVSSMKFRENGILRNGKQARVNEILREGDVVELLLEEEARCSGHLELEVAPVTVLYEDEDLIAVWKEAGVVVHPSRGHYRDTLSNRLHTYFEEKNQQVTIRSVGRLDKDTCGILVFGKNQVAAARLWKQKEEGIFQKEYLAVCRGTFQEEAPLDCQKTIWKEEEPACEKIFPDAALCVREKISPGEEPSACEKIFPDAAPPACEKIFPEEAPSICGGNLPGGGWRTINTPIAEAPGEKGKMCISDSGLPAVTHYQILGKREEGTLIRVRIETGRTHQIRVHMASIGHPLAGDPIYGNGEGMNPLMCLCAWRAELVQPFTGEKVRIEAGEELLPFFCRGVPPRL